MGFKSYSTLTSAASTETGEAIANRDAGEIIFAAGQPPELRPRAASLLSTWELSAANKGLTRQYTFSSFSKAWKFMASVACECKAKKHHPSWSNLYNKVTVEWTTHQPEGLTVKDIEMAEFCDRKADEIGLGDE
jgi:4a-hydroxytetrahydrobiopterin dehydratase